MTRNLYLLIAFIYFPLPPVSGIHTDDHFSYEFTCSTKFFKAVCFPHAEIVSDVRPATSVLPHFLNALSALLFHTDSKEVRSGCGGPGNATYSDKDIPMPDM